MNITFTAHCVRCYFFVRGELGCFYSICWHFNFDSYEQAQVLSKKVVTFSLVPVQQCLCDCTGSVAPHEFQRVSNALQVCGNPECHEECGAQFCDILRLPLLTHMQYIGDQHPTEKQRVELCCSPHEVVCPERHPFFPEFFNPSCHCMIWHRCIATCFKQSLKTLCFTTSCHFNFDPGTLF